MPTLKQKERSSRLLQAALREFCKHGFRDSSIDVVAKRANVSKATIYHHFSSKKELFISVFEYAVDNADRKVFPPFDTGTDLIENIKLSLRIFIKDVVEIPEYNFLFKVFTLDTGLIPEDIRKKCLVKFFDSGFFLSRNHILVAQASGLLKKNISPDLLLNAAIGMIMHVLTSWEFTKRRSSLEKVIEQITELIFFGSVAGRAK